VTWKRQWPCDVLSGCLPGAGGGAPGRAGRRAPRRHDV